MRLIAERLAIGVPAGACTAVQETFSKAGAPDSAKLLMSGTCRDLKPEKPV